MLPVVVSRLTGTRYLEELVKGVFLRKQKIGRSNFYPNLALYPILAGTEVDRDDQVNKLE